MKLSHSFFLALLFICFFHLPATGQKKKGQNLKLNAGLLLSHASEAEVLNYSFQFGLDYKLGDQWSLGSFAQSLHARQFYYSFTLGLLADYKSHPRSRFYYGIGPVYQMAPNLYSEHKSFNHLFIPGYRMGYKIPFKYVNIIPECLATGPFIYNGDVEIFTIFSLGVKVQVNRWR